ncbi:hypothetical protein [Streptomyces sp. NPDC021562]|uniref:hypothetical protein n=1 Tax=Streptomyces sp. NPDC021562 TaxID=3155121 RepID=UPI0033ED07F6
MKSERPENDEDAAADAAPETPEPKGTPGPATRPEADPRTEAAAAEPKTPPSPAPADADEPEAAPAARAEDEAGVTSPETPETAADPAADPNTEAAEAAPEAASAPAARAEDEAGVTSPERATDPAVAPETEATAARGPETATPAPAPKAGSAGAGEPGAATAPAADPAPEAASAPAARAEGDAGVVASAEGGGGAGSGVELVPRFEGDGDGRPVRRRSGALVVASVAAAVLLVGGGSAYLVAGGGGSGSGAGAAGGSAPPALALDGYSAGGNGIAPGEPNPYGVTYRAGGTLPDGPASAAVYQPSGEVSKDRVAALAKALGITGAPVAEGQVWKVGTDNDGSGGSLQVNRAAPGLWTYSHYAPGTDACTSTVTCVKDPASPAGAPVGPAAAEKAAAPVLKALGEDAAKLDASQVMGAQRVVRADPVVGGLPTYGWTTGLTVGSQGELVGGNGMLAAPVKGDTYPVLGAARTLALLNAAPGTGHRMGIGGCTRSVPLKDRLEQPCDASKPSVSPAVKAVVEKAVFGLAAQSVAGRQALVPSWLFQVRGAGSADPYTVTYPAVDPKYLASAATPSASTGATPRDVKVDGYTTDGRELVVAFTGGVCADYKVTADGGAAQVAVKVTATPWPDKVCVMIAKQYHRAVRLEAPLDGRKVVGTDGRAVPKERPTTLDPQLG